MKLLTSYIDRERCSAYHHQEEKNAAKEMNETTRSIPGSERIFVLEEKETLQI